jgi:hypothetical protein
MKKKHMDDKVNQGQGKGYSSDPHNTQTNNKLRKRQARGTAREKSYILGRVKVMGCGRTPTGWGGGGKNKNQQAS